MLGGRQLPDTKARRRAVVDEVDANDLVEAKTAALRAIAELVEQRDDVDTRYWMRYATHAKRIARGPKSERCWATPSRRLSANTPQSSRRSIIPVAGSRAPRWFVETCRQAESSGIGCIRHRGLSTACQRLVDAT
jgi:hypothetical protein